MKVSGVRPGAVAAGGARKADKAQAGKGEFKRALVDAMESMEEVHAAEAPTSLGGVEAALMVQEVGDATEREARQRLIRRGEEVLDRLEDLRHGLLMGVVPREKLDAMVQVVRRQRDTCHDPRLAALLDEIELRAEVEIAKLGG